MAPECVAFTSAGTSAPAEAPDGDESAESAAELLGARRLGDTRRPAVFDSAILSDFALPSPAVGDTSTRGRLHMRHCFKRQ